MTLALDALRREAEEGLAIAEKATSGPLVPWRDSERDRGYSVCTVDRDGLGDVDIADTLTEEDSSFFADARTRAPNAYRAVGLLCDLLQESERRLTEALADAEHLRGELNRYRSIFGDAPDSVG